MNAKKLSTLAIAAVIAVNLAACADMKITPSGPVPEGRVATADGSLLDAVRWELSMMGVKGITATVANSEVTLKGDVSSGQELVRIATAVQGVPGVRAVIPDVNVKN
jgi:hypothetical protein